MALTIIPGARVPDAVGAVADGFSSGGRVQNAIASAARQSGVAFDYLYKQAKIESGLNPTAKATTSSASGLYQFIEQTWLGTVEKHGAEHGLGWAANAIEKGSDGRFHVSDQATRAQILALRQDPETSAAMAGEYASDNKQYLESRLGREAGSVDLYLAHFLGPAGASRFLAARASDGSRPAAAVNPAAAGANRWVFYNKDGSARSLDEVYAKFAARFDQSGSPSTSPASGRTAVASAASARPLDTASELMRMQLAALNGGDGQGGTSIADLTRPQALLTPSPRTAKLAYLMFSTMGA